MGSVGNLSSNNINAGQMSNLPIGSQVEIQNISSITGRPTGQVTTLTLQEKFYSGDSNPVQVWTGSGYSDIRNNSVDIFNTLGQREIKLKRRK